MGEITKGVAMSLSERLKNATPAEKQQALKRLADALEAGSDCEACGGKVDDHQLFCMRCGMENPNFNEATFQKEWGKTSAKYRTEECESGHPGLERTRTEAPEYVGKLPHCTMCGARVLA